MLLVNTGNATTPRTAMGLVHICFDQNTGSMKPVGCVIWLLYIIILNCTARCTTEAMKEGHTLLGFLQAEHKDIENEVRPATGSSALAMGVIGTTFGIFRLHDFIATLLASQAQHGMMLALRLEIKST